MSALDRKLGRDLWRLKGQVATIALVLACGVMAMIMMRSTWQSLLEARDDYYEQYRFGHVFAHLERAPEHVAQRLAAIPGVGEVYTRLVQAVMVPMADEPDPVTSQIVSLPDAGEPPMNRLYLRTGRLPAPGADEAVILESFALAHQLGPGDRIPIVINGRRRDLAVVGVALSPEFVFATAGGEAIPDGRRFVVAWLPRGAIARAFEMEGAFNDVVLRLTPGSSEPRVLDAVDRELAAYGGRHAVGRARQVSNYILSMRLDILQTIALVIPSVFLLVAAFLVNVVVSRLVFLERTQIAVLKALGLGNARIARHYLVLVALIVGIGAIVGVAFGAWSGRWMSRLYAEFYTFPTRRYRISAELLVITIAVGLAAALGGALGAVRRIARMPPAEAMRPPTPLAYRSSAVERAVGATIGPSAMMVAREIRRRPVRFAMSCAGIAMGVAIYISGQFSTDSFDRQMTEVFPREQRQDLTVTFPRALPSRVVHELEHLPGVLLAEGHRQVPVRVRAGARWRDTIVTGLPAASQLRILYDAGQTEVAVPAQGLVMCDRLAAALGVAVGDEVELEVLEGAYATRRAPVARLIGEAFGLPVYARADWLAGLLREAPRVSTALLRVDPRRSDELSARLKQAPMVISVTRQARVIERYEDQVGSSMVVMTLILTLSAAAIATGVVYNNARIALSMRSRDLASLRVLGFTRREVSSVLLGELGVQVVVGVIAGLVVGRWGSEMLSRSLPSEAFHFDTYIAPHTYAAAAVIALCSGIASALLVRRKLDDLDLVAVLKASE